MMRARTRLESLYRQRLDMHFAILDASSSLRNACSALIVDDASETRQAWELLDIAIAYQSCHSAASDAAPAVDDDGELFNFQLSIFSFHDTERRCRQTRRTATSNPLLGI